MKQLPTTPRHISNVSNRLYDDIWLRGCQFAASIEDPAERFAAVQDVFAEFIDVVPEAQNLAHDMQHFIVRNVEQTSRFSVASDELAARMAVDVPEDDPEKRYFYMKVLAGTTLRVGRGSYDPWLPNTIFGSMVAAKSMPLVQALREDVAEGKFDSCIARDIVAFVASDESIVQNGMLKIKDLFDYTQAYDPESSVESVILRQAANHASWPRDARISFETAKAKLIADFDKYKVWALSGHGAGNYLAIANNTQDRRASFARSVSDYVARLADANRSFEVGGFNGGMSGNARRTHVEAVRAAVAAKRRQGGKSTARKAVARTQQTSRAAVESVAPIPWRLVQLRTDGSTVLGHADSEAVVASIKEAYFDKYKNATHQAMSHFIDSVMENMCVLDLSRGPRGGIEKLTDASLKNKTANHATSMPLFRYRPRNDVGFSGAADRADKIRVLFAQLPERALGILAILEKDDVTEYLRNIGIKAAGRKG